VTVIADWWTQTKHTLGILLVAFHCVISTHDISQEYVLYQHGALYWFSHRHINTQALSADEQNMQNCQLCEAPPEHELTIEVFTCGYTATPTPPPHSPLPLPQQSLKLMREYLSNKNGRQTALITKQVT
jgi:hypothetical protein